MSCIWTLFLSSRTRPTSCLWLRLNGNGVQKFLVFQIFLVASSNPIACCEVIGTVLRTPNVCHLRTAEARCGLTRVSSTVCRSKVERLDDLEHIGGSSLLLQGFAELLSRAEKFSMAIHSLSGKVLDQFNLFVGESADFLTVKL